MVAAVDIEAELDEMPESIPADPNVDVYKRQGNNLPSDNNP